jgi:hypothetical protein
MHQGRRARLALVLLSASAMVAGCASIFSLEELPLGSSPDAAADASPTDAATKDSFVPGVDAGNPCTATGYPGPPTADSPGGSDVTFTVALSKLDFGLSSTPDGGDGGSVQIAGYNLDAFCTNTTGANSCIATKNGTDYNKYVLDKAAGVDNAGYALLQYIGTLGDSFKAANVNERLQNGEYGVVISVVGYNGLANDTQVTVEYFPSYGVAGGLTLTPADQWRVDTNDLVNADHSKTSDPQAYVTGNKLVAHFALAPLKMTVDSDNPLLVLGFSDAVVTADIVPDATGFRVTNGVVAGRWAIKDFLTSVDSLKYSPFSGFPPTPLCQQSSLETTIVKTVCGARDIMATSTRDNMAQTCDAFSAGAGFDSYAIDKWVKGTGPTVPDAGCGPTPSCP